MCSSAGRVSVSCLLSWLVAPVVPTMAAASWSDRWFDAANQAPLIPQYVSSLAELQGSSSRSHQEHNFTLKHIFDHGLYSHQDLHRRLDIRPEDDIWIASDAEGGRSLPGPLHAKSTKVQIERLSDRRIPTMQSLYHTARLTGNSATLDPSAWVLDEVSAPDTTDKQTVLAFARMSWDAYTAEPGTGEWQDATGKFNNSQGFGWEGDSLRGHIFADENNDTVVIALKGTSPGKSFFILEQIVYLCYTSVFTARCNLYQRVC